MTYQSTNHLLMIEPTSFYANPETMETNVYQVSEDVADRDDIFAKALEEFHGFKVALEERGVKVTTFKGLAQCPDMVFPNCLSTHRDGGVAKLFIYPMLNENRQAERDPKMIDALAREYSLVEDWTRYEAEGKALESTASIVMDRVNKIGYSGLSARTDEGLVRAWCDDMGYEPVIFNTQSHAGKPVYHTDCVMWVGTTLVGLCTGSLVGADQSRVLEHLQQNRVVVEFDEAQLRAFCGNALEVAGDDGEQYLAMSSGAYNALRDDQIDLISEHFMGVIHAPLPTLEKYGGGSARCMLMELF